MNYARTFFVMAGRAIVMNDREGCPGHPDTKGCAFPIEITGTSPVMTRLLELHTVRKR